ncbi:MarR family winged helix-turn-helix transcriptional regulator [Microbacterium invictum]|uniref:DNA-binding MarR family transcriptional regulator n=1 Tax=Microbacterium invictum TaxID=515415 RepID=A0AA40SMI6_9MICO|nr:MarR family transcriptional regulator [Microbacterium invictum]MBB4138840.1 DNA-binding MarR family transcriptional regulator [Microbacterium invictum]
MPRSEELLQLMIAAHALTRVAALDTRTETPAAQWRSLTLLRDHGPQRVGDLARLSRISQPGMTRLAGQLADAGLIERTSDATDSRVAILTVTPAGLSALDAWHDELRSALAPRFADLTDQEWATLNSAADILTRKTGVEAPERKIR